MFCRHHLSPFFDFGWHSADKRECAKRVARIFGRDISHSSYIYPIGASNLALGHQLDPYSGLEIRE